MREMREEGRQGMKEERREGDHCRNFHPTSARTSLFGRRCSHQWERGEDVSRSTVPAVAKHHRSCESWPTQSCSCRQRFHERSELMPAKAERPPAKDLAQSGAEDVQLPRADGVRSTMGMSCRRNSELGP